MQFHHELIVPNEDLPFKMFMFEGGDGNYYREKHWHRSIEIFAVLEGGLQFFINEVEHPLREGDIIIVNSNEIHSIYSPVQNRTVVLQIPLKTFEDYFTGDQFIRFAHHSKAHDRAAASLIEEMFASYEEKRCGYEMKVKSQYFMFLYLLVTQYRELEVNEDMVKRNKKLSKLSSITTYIKEHYTDELSLETLSEIFGYAPAYLSRMFQKYAGINYKSYLQDVRLEYASKELMNTEHPIGEIALDNGFPNSKAFAKAFRKKYGLLPSEYRKGGTTLRGW